MSLNRQRAWLIAYDIRDPRRLSRLYAFIRRHTIPVQYSVYLFEGHAGALGELLLKIRQRIDNAVDDVRAYLIPERVEIYTYGRGSLPASACYVSTLAGDHTAFTHSGATMAPAPREAEAIQLLSVRPTECSQPHEDSQ